MKFELTAAEHARVAQWLSGTVYPKLIADRKAKLAETGQAPSSVEAECWAQGYPYGGAIGGGLTYSFTPTSLGTVTEVSYAGFTDTLNLTDYDSW